MAKQIFTTEEAKRTERYFVMFLDKHRIEYRMHRSMTSAYFKIKFDGKNFLIRISDHPLINQNWEKPDFEVLNNRSFDKLKRIFKKVIRLSYKPAYNSI